MLDVLTQIKKMCTVKLFGFNFSRKLKDTKIKFTSHIFIEHKITTHTQKLHLQIYLSDTLK